MHLLKSISQMTGTVQAHEECREPPHSSAALVIQNKARSVHFKASRAIYHLADLFKQAHPSRTKYNDLSMSYIDSDKATECTPSILWLAWGENRSRKGEKGKRERHTGMVGDLALARLHVVKYQSQSGGKHVNRAKKRSWPSIAFL